MKKYPAIIFAVFFIFGILVQKQFDAPVIFLAGVSAVLTLLLFLSVKLSYSFLIKGVTACVLIAFLGAAYLGVYNSGRTKYPFEKVKLKNVTITGKVQSLELFREYEIRFRLKTDSSSIDSLHQSHGLVFLCRVREKDAPRLDSLYRKIADGNTVVVTGAISKGRDARNPFEFDYQKYIENSGVAGLFTVYSVNDVKIIDPAKNYFSSFIFNIRRQIDEKISQLHAPQPAALLKGLLIGDRSEISDDINAQFINSGVMHVVAISGQHVAYILIIFILLFGRFNIYLRSFFIVIGLLMFLFLTGLSASVFRAVVMALVVIAGYLSNRSVNGYNAISVSALILVLIDPNILFDPGFQLSYSAVLGMMTFGGYFVKKVNEWGLKSKILKWGAYLILVSIAAQIGTLPLSLYYFGKLSVVGLLANIIIVPLSGIIISIGIFTIFLAPIWMFGAQVYALVNNYLVYIALYLVKIMGDWKYSFVAINMFSLFDVIVTFILLSFLLLFYPKFENKKARLLFLLLIGANIYLFTSLDNVDYLPKNKLSVMMIDVGQGDSFLIRFPNGKTGLIDAGDASNYFDNGKQTILPLLQKLGIDRIDYAFLSHPESDHYGGFVALINLGKIERLYKTRCDTNVNIDVLFEKYCLQKGVPVIHYNNTPLNIGNTNVYFLNNDNTADMKSNDKSGVIKIVYGASSFLFTGDAGKRREHELMDKYGSFVNCSVLKVAHHGSRTSSSEAWLKAAAPQFAMISAGRDNRFKHPSAETLQKLNLFNIKTFRTDINGAVLFTTEGDSIQCLSSAGKIIN